MLTYSFSSFHHFYISVYLSYSNVFWKAVPMQHVIDTDILSSFFFFFFLHIGYFCPPWLHAILHFSHDRFNWSCTFFSKTTFQNFPGIADLFSEVSKFQHHVKLCCKCSILLGSSLNLSSICWWKESSSCWMLLLPWYSWIKLHL